MTEESCISYCSGLNYVYAGVEYSAQCCMTITILELHIDILTNYQTVAILWRMDIALNPIPTVIWVAQEMLMSHAVVQIESLCS